MYSILYNNPSVVVIGVAVVSAGIFGQRMARGRRGWWWFTEEFESGLISMNDT